MIATMRPETVRRALDLPRLTLGDIAERLGVTTAALNKYRQRERAMPSHVRVRLAELLDRHAAELTALAEALRHGEENAPPPRGEG